MFTHHLSDLSEVFGGRRWRGEIRSREKIGEGKRPKTVVDLKKEKTCISNEFSVHKVHNFSKES